LAPVPEALVWLTAPCRCTTPEPSVYQAGARESKPVLVQFAVLSAIGCGADRTPGASRPTAASAGAMVVKVRARAVRPAAVAASPRTASQRTPVYWAGLDGPAVMPPGWPGHRRA